MRQQLPLVLFALLPVASGRAQATWTNLTGPSTPVLGMDFSGAFDEARARIVLFGGHIETSSSAGVVDDQWQWDGTTWSSPSVGVKPPPRYRHDMAYDAVRGVIVLCGGFDGNSRLPDTWEFDGQTWILRNTAGPNEELYNHRMVFDAARGVVMRFGGSGAGGFKGDTHVWTGSAWQLRTSGGPPARDQHAMGYDALHQSVVLFGGWSATGYLQDTWTWDGTAWLQRTPATVPGARAEAGLAPTGSSRKLVLFGGYGGPSEYGDTWAWDGTNWTSLPTTGSPPPMAYFKLMLDTARDRVELVRGQEFSTYHVGQWELNVPTTAPASFTAFGSGCPSSVGVPQLAAAPGSLPFIGNTFTLHLTGIPTTIFNPAFLVSGLSRTNWNGSPLPLDLGAYGMPGCTALVSADATELLLNNGGVATKTWNVPFTTSLVGVEFYSQGAALDPGINAASFVVSNAGTVHIGQL